MGKANKVVLPSKAIDSICSVKQSPELSAVDERRTQAMKLISQSVDGVWAEQHLRGRSEVEMLNLLNVSFHGKKWVGLMT